MTLCVKEFCTNRYKKAGEIRIRKNTMTCEEIQDYLEEERVELAKLIGNIDGGITPEDETLLNYTCRFVLFILLNG